ncbi:MAG: hypothetical protein U1E65_29340 [Myxococcota bacterium]
MAIESKRTVLPTIAELQKQVDEAKPGAIIHLGEGTIRGCLIIDKPITLRGAGADRTVIDGWGKGPVIAVDAEAGEVRLEELALSGGRATAGAAVSIHNGATVIIVGCLLEKCSAKSGRGGAVAIDRGVVVIQESTLLDNRAQLGGALWVGEQARAEVRSSILAQNIAIRGGAVAVSGEAELDLSTCRLERNRAEIDGHHVYMYGNPSGFPRAALANALLGSVEPTAAPIANVAPYRGSLILENTSVAREFMPSQLIG